MKKIYFAICCALMVGTSFAQDAAPPAVHPGDAPVAEIVENVAAVVQQPVTQAAEVVVETAAPAQEPVIQEAAIVNEVVVEGSAPTLEAPVVYSQDVAPAMTYETQDLSLVQPYVEAAPAAGCAGCAANSVMTPSIAAPSYSVAPVAVAAPISTPMDASYVAAPATCQNCNNGTTRRYVVRGAATRVSTVGRSVVSRVRGRRNNCCN